MIANPSKPLVDVISGGRYTGHKLKMLIGAIQTKLNSNAPSDEFKVCFRLIDMMILILIFMKATYPEI